MWQVSHGRAARGNPASQAELNPNKKLPKAKASTTGAQQKPTPKIVDGLEWDVNRGFGKPLPKKFARGKGKPIPTALKAPPRAKKTRSRSGGNKTIDKAIRTGTILEL